MKSFVLFLLFFVSFRGDSQTQNYIIVLKDKLFSSNEIHSILSPKANQKRKDFGIQFDQYDLPVSPTYLDELSTSCSIKNKSKWLNACLVCTELSPKELSFKYPFIKQVIELNPKPERYSPLMGTGSRADSSLYNFTYNQLETTHTASCLHDMGYKGEGVLIAVLDAGFPRVDSTLAFGHLRNNNRIIDTWDFEDNAPFVYHKNNHGAFVSSIITGELDSLFIGSAPRADFAFYITEIASVEINQEEYNLVLGLERADSIGADIASISLGYRDFDTLQISYGYPGMDGQTTIVAQGVKIARDKGIIVVASAGNSGSNGSGSIASPCDVDSILCVGAINYDSTKAGFSSEGPTFDGRIKPDVTTIGDSCYFIDLHDTVRFGNGTSFSCPLTSGLVACLKQAHPSRTNYQIVEAMKLGANQSNSPDNLFGWGIPDGCKVDSVLTVMDSLAIGIKEQLPPITFNLFPNPASEEITIITEAIVKEIRIIDLQGKVVFLTSLTSFTPSLSVDLSFLKSGQYMVCILDINHQVATTIFSKL